MPSQRAGEYAYRVYDQDAVRRLRHILVLRKLRIPLKTIGWILNDPGQTRIMEVFAQSVSELDEEITALNIIRDVLNHFVTRLNESAGLAIETCLLQDGDIIQIIESLSLSRINFKEERSMDELEKANEALGKLKSARIILLQPCAVAAAHFVGENPEETVGEILDRFVVESRLYEIKPDARMYGFNHPNPSPDRPHHGYETWVTIPEEMDVPAPLVKKRFEGGLYAAHAIEFPNFHEWRLLHKWAEESEKYAPNYSEQGKENMSGCLEEHLNWVYAAHLRWPTERISGMLDLLLPVKFR